MKYLRTVPLACALVLALGLIGALTPTLSAQEPTLDGPYWSEPETLTISADAFSSIQLLAGPDGVAHLLWLDYNEDLLTNMLVVRSRNAKGLWSAETMISELDQSPGSFSAALDAQSSLHVAWQEDRLITYRKMESDGDWLPNVTWDECGVTPAVIPIDDGGVYVICGDFYVVRADPSGVFSAPQDVSFPGITISDSMPAYAAAADGTLHIAFRGYGEDESAHNIFHSSTDGATGWAEAVLLSDTVSESHSPELAVDPANTVAVAWEARSGADDDNFYLRERKDGEWQSTQLLLAGERNEWLGSLQFSSTGELHMVYGASGTSVDFVYYKRRSAAGVWEEEPEMFVDSLSFDLSAEGTAHALNANVYVDGLDYAYAEAAQLWADSFPLTMNAVYSQQIDAYSDAFIAAIWLENVAEAEDSVLRFASASPENAQPPVYLPTVTRP